MATTTPTQPALTDDPFAAIGGGVKVNGGWVPKDHPAAAGASSGTGTGSGSSSAPLPPSSPSPTMGGGLASFNIPAVQAPTSPVSQSAPPPATTSPSFAGGFSIPGAIEGAGSAPVSPTPPKTVTVNGQTYTIPSAPTINTAVTTGTAPSASAATLAYAPEDPMLGTVREQLLAMMDRANATPSLNDATIKPQADAYTAAQERARRGLQADTAEAMSARGLGSSGAMDAAQRQSYETMGQNIGEFNAKLLSDEQTARRGDLKSALEMANQLGMFKEKTALERDLATLDVQTKTNLANLDAQLKTAGLSVQERLGIMDAELKKYGIDLQGNLGLLQTVLKNEFDYAQLNVQSQIANLDANVKMQLGALDAQLRREGYSLQDRLALLDNEIRKYGIDTQGNLGNLEIALRRELGIGQLNLGLLNTMLQNQQFNDQLGWDMGKTIINSNASAVGG